MQRRRQRLGEIGVEVIPGRRDVRLREIEARFLAHVKSGLPPHHHQRRKSKPAAGCQKLDNSCPAGRCLSRLVQSGDGARRSRRFNNQKQDARGMPSPLAYFTLKRRERRAPLNLSRRLSASRTGRFCPCAGERLCEDSCMDGAIAENMHRLL